MSTAYDHRFVPALPYECECDPDEMMPCEQHMVLVQNREGASTRTGDELLSVFVHDAVFYGVELSAWGMDLLSGYDAALESNRRYGVAWLPEGHQILAEEMDTLRNQVETSLATMDDPIYVHWDDGYVMYRLTPDCPLRDDE